MDTSDIDEALRDESDLSDFEDSGSEYLPSEENDSGSEYDELEDDPVDNEYHDIGVVESLSDEEVDGHVAVNEPNLAGNGLNNNNGAPQGTDNSNTWGDCTFIVRQYPFTGTSGVQYDFDMSDPMVVFNQFVTDEIINYMVDETNRFARQTLASVPVKRRSIMRKWLDCTPAEMRKFLGIILIMGLSPVPKMRLYWSANDIYEKTLIKKTMTRDRFDMLLKCWHFYNSEDNEPDVEPRLAKIKPLVDMLNVRFQAIFVPAESIVVDESMIPWRGRLIIRQYNPQKAHKYGVKVYKLCATNGYTVKMKIYAGKDDLTGNTGHAQKVVEHLVSDLIGQGRTLYADNFYNSVPLAEKMLRNKTYLCGTLRADRRNNPKPFVKEKIKKGEIKALENANGVKIIKWQDKRRVLMISTRAEDTSNLVPTGKRNRAGEDVMKPTAVMAYNAAKKGVDISDQLSSYYSPLRKTTKWYKKVAIELLLGTSIVNALVIFNEEKPRQSKLELIKFREVLLRQLIKSEDGPAPTPPIVQQRGRFE